MGIYMDKFIELGYKLDGIVEITSALPILDAGGLKVENKFFFLGPKVIKQVLTAFPTEDIVITLGKRHSVIPNAIPRIPHKVF